MTAEIRVPTLGESITDATVAKWFKQPGDAVALDEILCELETDKVAVEVPAPVAGVLTDIAVGEGEDVEVGALLGTLEENAKGAAKPTAKTTPKPAPDVKHEATAKQAPAAKPVYDNMAPAAERLLQEHKVDPAQISGTGKDGRITKADVMAFLDKGAATEPVQEKAAAAPAAKPAAPRSLADREERVPMSRLRRTIASRLKEAQNTAAILTTFNEVDMSALKDLRSKYKDLFADKHGVRLGFMSLFAKACVVALKDIPSVNAEIDGNDIIYKNHYDIGIAVSSPQGLVVPVVRDVDQLSLAGIEKRIAELADAARDGKLAIADLQGATFSISNGGVFGSMLSTPILNPPQSGILGMHAIQDRPVARDGQVVIRPMMYVALSYDHRLVDGREAVTFLVRVKECLEDPERLLLDL